MRLIQLLGVVAIALLFSFCAEDPEMVQAKLEEAAKQNERDFIEALREHIASVEAKDFRRMIKTIPSDGDLTLVLPDGKKFTTAEEFRELHEPWFNQPEWSIKFQVLFTDVASEYGIAVCEATHRKPGENDVELVHKMHVTYAFKKIDDNWNMVMDHASTLEKTP